MSYSHVWFPVMAALALSMAASTSSGAQADPGSRPAARPEDVQTIDGLLRAFYEIVSGPGEQPRDWARDSTLYIDQIRFVAAAAGGQPRIRVMDHEAFTRYSEPVFRDGFYERETHRVTRQYGNIAHVFSTYETRRTPDGPIVARGVNSLQLFHDGERWWIASATWQAERPGDPIPQEFLPQK